MLVGYWFPKMKLKSYWSPRMMLMSYCSPRMMLMSYWSPGMMLMSYWSPKWSLWAIDPQEWCLWATDPWRMKFMSYGSMKNKVYELWIFKNEAYELHPQERRLWALEEHDIIELCIKSLIIFKDCSLFWQGWDDRVVGTAVSIVPTDTGREHIKWPSMNINNDQSFIILNPYNVLILLFPSHNSWLFKFIYKSKILLTVLLL